MFELPRSRPFPRDGHRRVVIESIEPEIDRGRFPIKRAIGEPVVVRADIFADGHDAIGAVLRSRFVSLIVGAGIEPWQEAPMRLVENDAWTGTFTPDRLGRWEYTIEAWIDEFATWRAALVKRVQANQVTEGDLLEGAALVRAAAARAIARAGRRGADHAAAAASRAEMAWLTTQALALESQADVARRVEMALDPALLAAVARHPNRTRSTTYAHHLGVLVERTRARTGAWYEMFPRSSSPVPGRSGTFREAEARLPDIAAMGFDVLYLPPIHPIGTSFRKGKGNALTAGPGDPGSPWAIGSPVGGHMAVEPGLGTLEDFDRFLSAARDVGLEIALDLAYQCSPDHPYVRERPAWFRHRPDGTIKYAENPPKKYQDIYPFDFDSDDWPALWQELKAIVLFWIEHGVRIFRVDNPHTKPFVFWEWMIGEVRDRYPDVIFLSEAFTRPKVMYYLAKLGFTQSYTYFTWRNTKEELTEYFTELTTAEVRDYFRPNLFANTPDILHAYLQTGGRPAFQVRLILAATLGASYGLYSGFELCEDRAVPGTEEYLDSEKYEFKQRDWNQPGHIKDVIAQVNRIRRAESALWHNAGLTFHNTDNPHILAYSKSHEGVPIVVIVNLDPENMQHGWVWIPPTLLGRVREARYEMEDLLDGATYPWSGESNYVKLDPTVRVAHILKPRQEP